MHPGRGWFAAMLLLGVTFGLMLVASHEAWAEGDPLWAGFFTLLAMVDVAMYFWVTHLWVNYLYG